MGAFIIGDLLRQKKNRLHLHLLAGKAGLAKRIYQSNVDIYLSEKTDLHHIRKGSILIVGHDAWMHLASPSDCCENAFSDALLKSSISAVIFSQVNVLPNCLIDLSDSHKIPFFSSAYDEYLLCSRIQGVLRESIEHIATVQGVFVRVFGVGIIIKGESGLGKSECALELIARGHQVIADDLIEVQKEDDCTISGRSPENSRNLLYIKGLGIINVKELYGANAVLDRARVDMIVEFVECDKDLVIGQDMIFETVMDVNIPAASIPVRPNQMTTIIEVIAKRFLFEGATANGGKPQRAEA